MKRPTRRPAHAAAVAHDLNNLLSIIRTTAEAALDRPIDSLARDDLVHIRLAADRAAAAVRRLLHPAARPPLRPAILASAVADLEPLLRAMLGPGIDLMLDDSSAAATVRLDPTHLQEALFNLAANARDAMPGGGRLTIDTATAETATSLAGHPDAVPPGRYATLTVRDTGGGIPQALLPRLFQPFTTTKAHGTGLGLAAVRDMAHRHNGFVTLASSPAGTEIRLWLPRLTDPAAAPPRGLLILVEDETLLRRHTARLLRDHGWIVRPFRHADPALRQLTATRAPALLISDLGLPGTDGLTLATAARKIRPRLPILLITGYPDETLPADLAPAEILLKPFAAAELLDAIHRLAQSAGFA